MQNPKNIIKKMVVTIGGTTKVVPVTLPKIVPTPQRKNLWLPQLQTVK